MMMICRIAFCPKCFKAGRPKIAEQFVVYRGESADDDGEYLVGRVEINVEHLGFTPHTFELQDVKEVDGKAFARVKKCCGMNGCMTFLDQVQIMPDQPKKYKIYQNEPYDVVIPIEDWNALVKDWHDTGYELH